jgi:hypothetical protein
MRCIRHIYYNVLTPFVACNINYHHDYRVKRGKRMYNEQIPDVLQVGEHQFVEQQVIQSWGAPGSL